MTDSKKKAESISGLGRRKTSIARVHITPGAGEFKVNGKKKDNYFDTDELKNVVEGPLKVADQKGKFNINVNVKGGGKNGQAGAIILGLSRSLLKNDETLLAIFKEHGYLTRDPRMKERKKPGLHGARRATQFSKR